MEVALFDFELARERIALRPASPRDAAKLLVVDRELEDRVVRDLPGPFCGAIGWRAYGTSGDQAGHNRNLGPIAGVTFREKGKLVSVLGRTVRLAPRGGWYYVILSGGSDADELLRPVEEITPQ
jgi:hypothetical protein